MNTTKGLKKKKKLLKSNISTELIIIQEKTKPKFTQCHNNNESCRNNVDSVFNKKNSFRESIFLNCFFNCILGIKRCRDGTKPLLFPKKDLPIKCITLKSCPSGYLCTHRMCCKIKF